MVNQKPSPTSSARYSRLVILLSLIGLALTVISLFHYVALQNNLDLSSSFCHVSETLNCDKVNASQYSAFFGIPVASYGIFFYLITILVALGSFASGAAVLFVFSLIAAAVSIALFFVSELLIGALCPLCLAGYVVNFALLGVTWMANRQEGRPIARGIRAIVEAPISLFAPASSKGLAWIFAVGILGSGYVAISLSDVLLTRFLIPSSYDSKMQEAIKEASAEWSKARVTPVSVNADGSSLGDYTMGPKGAPIQLVEYSDFECPFCRRFFFELKDFLKNYPDKVQFVLKNYPLDKSCNAKMPGEMHQNACHAAVFSRCAGEQGRFWEATAFLFELPALDEPTPNAREEILAGIQSLSLDADAMRECMASDRQTKKIAEDIAEADQAGLTGTPFLLVNGKRVKVPNTDVLKNIFEQVLKAP